MKLEGSRTLLYNVNVDVSPVPAASLETSSRKERRSGSLSCVGDSVLITRETTLPAHGRAHLGCWPATFPSTVIPFFIAHSPTSGNEDCTTARWCASRPIQRLSGHFIIPMVWSRVDWRTLNASLSDQITRLEIEKTEISEDRDAVFCGDENRSVKTAWGEDVFASINIIHHRLAFFFFPSPRCSAGVSAFSSCCIQSRNSSVQIFFLFPFGHAGETHREDMKTLNSLHQLKHGVLTKRNT